MLIDLDALYTLPDVIHALPFYLYDDVKRQPARCELVVHPAHGWTVATELEQGAVGSLMQCPVTLAAKVCQQYGIAPGALSLFTRYAYSSNYENVYAVRFGHGERDLFNDVSFLAPRRDMLSPEDVAALVQALQQGKAPAPNWRALATPAS
ncbi:hypothetical protein [Hymenobacter sublimis]|uniref:Uncharacterized protein n=1 Tax=Hymenobacter sublimis TaxID=2933777 RepID=A0ABY4JH00_9BACT|nr:hypothetical protein [Hymenobacter sublimis]UPL51274.1 hypothetical protein MWH26_19695 [Hymenobacter sublimis]